MVILSWWRSSDFNPRSFDLNSQDGVVRVATELVRQAVQLQEMEQAIRRFDQLMSQADQRAKDAEDKASAAVTAIGVVKTLEQRKIKLNDRDAEKFWRLRRTRQTEELRGVLGRGRDVLECSGTRLVCQTALGVGFRHPRPGDRDE